MRQRRLVGSLKDLPITFANVRDHKLSDMLEVCGGTGRLYLCGTLEEANRAYMEEPLKKGWKFDRPYIHKYRSPFFSKAAGKRIAVKLVSESWLPGCFDKTEAIVAWYELDNVWGEATGLPLLSTPSKTGQALLWQSLPKNEDFPSLPDELALHIRSISPQHRLEILQPGFQGEYWKYDGRWMYASAAKTDRLPIGEPIATSEFVPYRPGWYRVTVTVPYNWHHIGLIPVKNDELTGGWNYPNVAGHVFETWASEPELTLAHSCGWGVTVHEGWTFERGRPLENWTKKLIDIRSRLTKVNLFAGAAIREILNHTIGSFHVDAYERERVVDQMQWRSFIAKYGYSGVRTLPRSDEEMEAGLRRVMVKEKADDRLSIYMPHWSSQIWSLERAWMAKHALRCPMESIIEIRGDALHLDREFSFEDKGHLGQLRFKGKGSFARMNYTEGGRHES